jgi:hypothetical protein
MRSDEFRERFQALRQRVQQLYQAAAPATPYVLISHWTDRYRKCVATRAVGGVNHDN